MYVLTFFGTSCFHSDSRIHTMCHFSRTKHSQYTHRFLIDMHTHTRARACAQHNRSAMAAKWRRRRALHASVLYYFRVREISSESPRLIYHGSRPEFFGFTRPPPSPKTSNPPATHKRCSGQHLFIYIRRKCGRSCFVCVPPPPPPMAAKRALGRAAIATIYHGSKNNHGGNVDTGRGGGERR